MTAALRLALISPHSHVPNLPAVPPSCPPAHAPCTTSITSLWLVGAPLEWPIHEEWLRNTSQDQASRDAAARRGLDPMERSGGCVVPRGKAVLSFFRGCGVSPSSSDKGRMYFHDISGSKSAAVPRHAHNLSFAEAYPAKCVGEGFGVSISGGAQIW